MDKVLSAWLAVWHGPGRLWAGMMKAGSLTVWQRFGGALVVTALLALLIWILWQGPWTQDVEAARLEWLGRLAIGLVLAVVICIVALFDYRFAGSFNKAGASFSMADGDLPDAPPPPLPPPEPAAGGELPADQQAPRP
jgi:hypothetical protein